MLDQYTSGAPKYRHEVKQRISPADAVILRQRLNAVMQRDKNAPDGSYVIRSLYFDNAEDRALREKLDGVNRREKFRLRIYNADTEHILLEKKSKINGLCLKERCELTKSEAEALMRGDSQYAVSCEKPLLRELGVKMRLCGLRAKTLVEYKREPFVFPAGNVRVTLDSGIRTGLCATELLDPDCTLIPAGESCSILEVKWDEFLPDIVRGAVQLDSVRSEAFSKYAACRIYG